MVEGTEAVLQRIKIALSLKRGTFPYDKDMGLDYKEMDLTVERNLKTLETLINEAVFSVCNCKAELVNYSPDTRTAELIFGFENDARRAEVKLIG